jgi:uncharacterized protein YlaN (UPF0358 family)
LTQTPDTPRWQRVEKLAYQLRREIELGIRLGEIDPEFGFQFFCVRADGESVCKGKFTLTQYEYPEIA